MAITKVIILPDYAPLIIFAYIFITHTAHYATDGSSEHLQKNFP